MAHTSLKQLFMGSICHWLSAHKRVGGGAGVKKNCVQLRSATGAFFGPAATLLCSLFAGSLSLTLLLRPEGSVAELIAGKILLLFPHLVHFKIPNPGGPDQAVRQLEEWSERHQKS